MPTSSKSLPCASKSPPSCGVLSFTISFASDVARPSIKTLLVIFLSPPPEVSTANNTSSLAAVDIAVKEPTATELLLSHL